jgi:uncharacterized protein
VLDPRFSLVGFLIGFLIGLTGMGGGSLMTPVMILVMGVKPVIAIGTDLAYGAITRVAGSAVHLRQNTVHRRSAYFLALGSVPASVLGVGVISAIRRTHPELVNVFLMRSVAWALIVVAAVLLGKPLLMRLAGTWGLRLTPDWRDDLQDMGDKHPWALSLIGAVVGFLVGFTSVGAGSLIIVALLFLYPRWQSRELVGTDVFHATILVSAASLAQLAAHNVNLQMMFSLLVGSLPGVLLGSRLVVRFPDQLVRVSIASVMLVSGAKLL